MTSVLIVAGENSGEKYGSQLIRAFKKRRSDVSFFGIGGRNMEAEGADILAPIEELSVVGLFEALRHIPRIKKIFARLHREIQARRPAAAVLIDSPDFNLRLAKVCRRESVPVLYYISPTVWAWRRGRLKTIKRSVDRMMLIFPFEKEIYARKNIPAVFVGHPLIEKIRLAFSREEFLRKYGLDPGRKLLTLLPGSRPTELKYHLPVLADAVDLIGPETRAQFVLVRAENIPGDFVRNLLPSHSPITVVDEDGYEAMAASDLILSACGTANMEACLLGIPFIAFYRLSPLTYYAGRNLLRIRHCSIVNILAGHRVVPELIQSDLTPEHLLREAKELLNCEDRRREMIAEFKKIRTALSEEPASENAARELDDLLVRSGG